jgi:hypothetical protein
MKDQINKLTEAQAKELLVAAMENFQSAVYAESNTEEMACAKNLGVLKNKIESLAKSNQK